MSTNFQLAAKALAIVSLLISTACSSAANPAAVATTATGTGFQTESVRNSSEWHKHAGNRQGKWQHHNNYQQHHTYSRPDTQVHITTLATTADNDCNYQRPICN